MPAIVIAFPGAASADRTGPCRFTARARNVISGLVDSLPCWSVEYAESDGGDEWATLTEVVGPNASLSRCLANDAAFVVCAEVDDRLVLRDKDFVRIGTFATPAELVAELRRWSWQTA